MGTAAGLLPLPSTQHVPGSKGTRSAENLDSLVTTSLAFPSSQIHTAPPEIKTPQEIRWRRDYTKINKFSSMKIFSSRKTELPFSFRSTGLKNLL